MVPETGQYPWAVWGPADEILVVTAGTPVPGQSLEFSDEGPPIALDPYGKICFEVMFNGAIAFTPWIHITVSPMVIPVPAEFSGLYRVFESTAPGQTLTIDIQDVTQLSEPPKKPKKNK